MTSKGPLSEFRRKPAPPSQRKIGSTLGGSWLRELADRCAYAAQAATTGGGPKHIARLEEMIQKEAEARGIHVHDVARAVAREWYKRGITSGADLLRVGT